MSWRRAALPPRRVAVVTAPVGRWRLRGRGLERLSGNTARGRSHQRFSPAGRGAEQEADLRPGEACGHLEVTWRSPGGHLEVGSLSVSPALEVM
ncbi:hypothetical protein EYF80_063744 [Liparis tanakae]|uniref:Uncharacterized protein n=1 Tax=Liparis tanakae TaxID=230148 RepID=A0A4Z2EBI4_9TELE|nr:hypothetical protein EYF80_063744 [Liparis tanakae]